MARQTKDSVIAELKIKGIEFDPQAKYDVLWDLLKEKLPEPKAILPEALIERAKNIGFTDEQISTYTDPTDLEMACNRLKPQATPQPAPKKPRPKYRIVADKPKGEPAVIKTTTTISVMRAQNVRRSDYDESLLWMFCRKNKIKPEDIRKITLERDCVPDKKENLTTFITVDYWK